MSTSEQKLGIDMPPEHQCQKIDQYIRTVKEIQINLRHLEQESKYLSGDVGDLVSDIRWDIDYFEDNLESLRAALEGVRDWGNEWKHLAKELINKYEPELLEEDNDS